MSVSSTDIAGVKKASPRGDSTLRSLRILFNTPNPALHGGPPTHLPVLEKALSKLVEIQPYEYGRKSDFETLAQKVLGRIGDLARIRRMCRKVHPDLIHHNSSFDQRAILRDAPLVLLAKREQVPIFIKVHGSLPEGFRGGSMLLDRARRIVLSNADRIGVLSTAEKCEFEEAFPNVRGKVSVVKNATNPQFSAVERREADLPTILFLSRFIRKKGPFDLLHAVPLVLEKEPAAHFLFVGDGEDAEAFDREVAAMNLGPAVRRITHIINRECAALYAKAWMLVFPTYFPEGMPMVLGEAMAAGVPIISTPTRFCRSYMTEGVHVIYHQPGDVKAIAANVLKLCLDGNLRERMSTANRKLALGYFTTNDVTQEYIDVYRKVLSGATRHESRA